MSQIKISELPTLVTQLQNSDYVPVVSGGVNYKYIPFNYLVKNSGNEAISGVKTFSSSPVVPLGGTGQQAAPMTYVIPPSDIGRLTEISGDGIPDMPDGTATQRVNYFTAVPSGWTANGTPTTTFSNGVWRMTLSGPNHGYYKGATNNIVRMKIRVLSGTLTYGLNGGQQYTDTNSLWHYIDSVVTGTVAFIFYGNTGSVFEIADLYIGTGVYSSPLHDKSGNVIWTNNGLLPVDGYRGKGLLCNGSSYAQANNPVIGTTGTLAFQFSQANRTVTQGLFTNEINGTNGISCFINTSGNIILRLSRSGTDSSFTIATITDSSPHSLFIRFTSPTSISYKLDNGAWTTQAITAFVGGTINAYISYVGGNFFSGTLYNLKAWNRVLSDDECISWANDPAGVDSNVGKNQIEFASNSDASSTPSVTASGFLNGFDNYGAFGNWAVGTAWTRRVKFLTPINWGKDSFNFWVKLMSDGRIWPFATNMVTLMLQNTTIYGYSIDPVHSDPYSLDITFHPGGRYPSGSTYGSYGAPFSEFGAGWCWFVEKITYN